MRANTSHEVAEQIRVCAGSTPAYKGVAGVYEVCTLTEEKVGIPAVYRHGTEQNRADNPCI